MTITKDKMPWTPPPDKLVVAFEFIRDFQRERLYSPSYDEIAEAPQYPTRSMVFVVMQYLERLGAIRRDKHIPRKIDLLKQELTLDDAKKARQTVR